MRVAIVDDKLEEIAIAESSLKDYSQKRKTKPFEVCSFSDPLEFLSSQKKLPFDLVLLDICMPKMLGTDVAKEIRKEKDESEIIFLTTSDEFAVEAFSVDAAHYLVKPLVQKEFDEAMDRVMPRITKEDKKVSIKGVNGLLTVKLSEIYYVESDSHNLIVHGEDKEIETRMNLESLLKELDELSPNSFLLCAKGIIVNLAHIRLLSSSDITLTNGVRLPVSVRLRKEVKNAYFDYRFNEAHHG